jgi:hypothetical protein
MVTNEDSGALIVATGWTRGVGNLELARNEGDTAMWRKGRCTKVAQRRQRSHAARGMPERWTGFGNPGAYRFCENRFTAARAFGATTM